MKKILIILCIATILLTTGCEQKAQQVSLGAFLGGTEGLTYAFVQGEPPVTVLDNKNEPFFMTLQFENAGEYTVAEQEVLTTISGISYNTFNIAEASQRNANALEKGYLNKQTGEIVQGGIDQITYEAMYQDDLKYDLPFTIAANICYEYETQAVAQVCLSKEPTRRAQATDVCKITEEKIVGSSGAPLQITSFSERASGQNEVTVTFKIENLNIGESYPETYIDTKEDCVSDDKERNKVNVQVASQQAVEITCPKLEETGEVRLINNQATITCKINTGNLAEATPFEGAMDIQLNYIYKDFISTELTVENAL